MVTIDKADAMGSDQYRIANGQAVIHNRNRSRFHYAHDENGGCGLCSDACQTHPAFGKDGKEEHKNNDTKTIPLGRCSGGLCDYIPAYIISMAILILSPYWTVLVLSDLVK